MANSKSVANQYQQLTEHERARLMINADLNDDDQEFQRLKASAPIKTFTIRGEKESEIGNAWKNAHKDFLLCKHLINHNLRMCIDVFEDEIELRQYLEPLWLEMKTLELAFTDALASANLPVFHDLLKEFIGPLPIQTASPAEGLNIRQGRCYNQYHGLFSAALNH